MSGREHEGKARIETDSTFACDKRIGSEALVCSRIEDDERLGRGRCVDAARYLSWSFRKRDTMAGLEPLPLVV